MWEESIETSNQDRLHPPAWVTKGKIVQKIDARPMLDSENHPAHLVLKNSDRSKAGKMLELVTPFVPAPLIDLAIQKRCLTWTKEEAETEYKTYFTKK